MSSAARVSVVIPIHDADRYLAETIESVLAQTAPPLEVIVVDDGSTDRGPQIAQGFGPPVRYLRQERSGPAVARNRGISQARGDLIAFLDHDDLWEPGKLALQTARFEQEPRPDLVFGHLRQFVSPELDAHTAARIVCPPGPQAGLLFSTLLAGRGALERIGPLRDEFAIADTMALLMRAYELGMRVVTLDEVVTARRLHDRNLSYADNRAEYIQVIRESLARRRAGPG